MKVQILITRKDDSQIYVTDTMSETGYILVDLQKEEININYSPREKVVEQEGRR